MDLARMSPTLSVIHRGPNISIPAPGETVAERVRRLQAEAKDLAREHVKALARQIADLEVVAAEIAEGGEAYPPGVRDICRRLAEDCEARVQTLEAIVARS